jgi:NAD(P)-dependent dehydrogenase (short-subunit alcohol dehydrogenase family)
MARLDGKVACITGGASGLGEATVRLFQEEGASVIVADVADELGEALANELGDRVIYQHCNVVQESDIESAVARAVDQFGGLDIMFNNAGIGGSGASILQHTVEDWDTTMAVNLRGVFLGIKHAGRVMKTRGKGAIVNTASVSAHRVNVSPYAYTAAKAGVFQLTKMAANELGEYNVRVNSISPGMFFTRIYWGNVAEEKRAEMRDYYAAGSAAFNPMHRMGDPIEIAHTALYLGSDDSSYVNGEDIVVDGGGIRGSRWSNSPFGRVEAAENE